jgi:hypothetical protein
MTGADEQGLVVLHIAEGLQQKEIARLTLDLQKIGYPYRTVLQTTLKKETLHIGGRGKEG